MTLAVLAHRPEDPVALGRAGSRTALDLLADAGRVASVLAREPRGEVLLMCEDRYLFAAGLLGAWTAEHVVVLPPNGRSGVLAKLASGPLVRAFLDDRGEGTLDLRDVLRGPETSPARTTFDPQQPLATLMTSGSTGSHQRCDKTAAQLLGETATLAALFGLGDDARVLASVPPYHIYGLLFSVLLPLRCGGAFVRETPLHGDAVANAAVRTGANHLVSVPAHLHAMAAMRGPPRFARVFSSGAPLPVETARALRDGLGWAVTEVFGSSETGGIGWRAGPTERWRPFPGVTVSSGTGSRLLLDSPLLAAGTPRPLTCADAVAVSADGTFELLGRSDGVLKVGGKRVSIGEVEELLLALPGVKDAAATAHDADGPRGHEIWAAVVAPGWSPERLRSALARSLDPVAVPRRIRVVARLPRNDTGKLPRSDLLELLERPQQRASQITVESEESLRDSRGRDVRRFEMVVPADLAFFEGHFESRPVLPGVVQLERIVLRHVRRAWPDLCAVDRVLRLKFSRVIAPESRIVLTLARAEGARSVEFTIASARSSSASGTVHFRTV